MASEFGYQKILVAVDFADASTTALRRAIHLAEVAGAKLEVVYVVQDVKPVFPFSQRNRELVRDLRKELISEAEQRLEALVESAFAKSGGSKKAGSASARKPAIHTKVLAGTPSEKVLAHASRTKADLIVLGNRGHNSWQELLMGSTAERILFRSQVPVLMVPVPGHHRGRKTRKR